MAKIYITKPIRRFTNDNSEITIDATSYFDLYTSLVNLYPELRKCVKEIYDTKAFDFWFLVNGKILPYEELLLPIKKDAKIVFVPLIGGGGDSIGTILLGVALIAISIAIMNPALIGAYATAAFLGASTVGGIISGAAIVSTVASLTLSIGVSLALSGLMQAMAGQAPAKNANTNDSSIRSGNESFGSLVNTTSTNMPIPLIFGQIRVPGQFIGGRIKTINHNAGDVISLVNYI